MNPSWMPSAAPSICSPGLTGIFFIIAVSLQQLWDKGCLDGESWIAAPSAPSDVSKPDGRFFHVYHREFPPQFSSQAHRYDPQAFLGAPIRGVELIWESDL